MFDLPSWRVGRLFGIPIEVNASWLLVFVLVAVTLSANYYPVAYPGRSVTVNIASGIVTALLFFGSVVLHEVAHALVARAGGTRIQKITLFIFGGVAQMRDEPSSPGRELLMAVAGPGMSVLIALATFEGMIAMYLLGASSIWWAPLEYLALINVGVAVFNLLPGFPLDGGRVLRAGLWRATGDLLAATRWASMAGRGLGLLMASAGILGALLGSLDMIWFALLGWFLATMAANAYRDQEVRSRLGGLTTQSVMSAPPVVVPSEMSVQYFVDTVLPSGRHSHYPVVRGSQIVGMLDMDAVRSVPRERWGEVHLGTIAAPDVSDLLVDADAPLDSVLARLGPEGSGVLMVARQGRLAGILARSDVIGALRGRPRRR